MLNRTIWTIAACLNTAAAGAWALSGHKLPFIGFTLAALVSAGAALAVHLDYDPELDGE